MKKIYLDYAAATPVAPEVLKAMAPYFSEKFGNPGSLHSFGQEALKAVDESREKIAKAIGADFREIIFTGSATEANNLALRGVIKAVFNAEKLFSETAVLSPQRGEVPPGFQPRSVAFGGNHARSASETFSQTIFPHKNKTIKPPYRIIVSKIEHESILETARDLEKDGVETIYLPVDKNGVVDLKKLKESLNERTILVSIMYANNVIGTVQPITEIAKTISEFRKQKIENRSNQNSRFYFLESNFPLFHTDAVQAFQYLDCDVDDLGVDLMTLSSHKIHGPKGIGLLYAKSQIQNPKSQINSKFKIQNSKFLSPIITGGGQEFGLRSGTENVAAIVGFAKAIELAIKNREKEMKRIGELADYFWKEIKKIEPKAELNGASDVNPPAGGQVPDVKKLSNILNIYFPHRNAQDLLIKLDLAGVAISSGAACSARAMKPSYVLKAIGLAEQKIKSSLRFSFGKFTTKKEINETIKKNKKIKE